MNSKVSITHNDSLNIWRKHLTQILSALNLVGSKVLDVGCDSGYFSFLASELGAKSVIGIDIDESRINDARNYARILGKTGFVEFIVSDIHDFGRSAEFDIIILSEVLEHLENPRAALRKINGLLQNNGFLIISVPNPDSFLSRMATFIITKILRRYKPDTRAHKSVMPLNRLITVLKDTGFQIDTAYYYGLSLLNRLDMIDSIRSLSYILLHRSRFQSFLGTNIFVIAKK
ncbi:MAG: class I SAM-dependent methyltransferase [Candidatus Thorarchaeota archaeon]|nr:class I SAM-dependent methyltransferase [Candidatus Thorarchaeota archaeon]